MLIEELLPCCPQWPLPAASSWQPSLPCMAFQTLWPGSAPKIMFKQLRCFRSGCKVSKMNGKSRFKRAV